MNKTNIRQLKRNLHGVSVVIGALMLTLIVVTAAASFAIFTAQKQEELQEQEWQQLLREQEELEIIGIDNLNYDFSTEKLSDVSFVITSVHQRNSKLPSIMINDIPVKQFHVDRQVENDEGWIFSWGSYHLNLFVANTSSNESYLFVDANFNRRYDKNEDFIYDPDFDENGTKKTDLNPSSNDYVYLYAKDQDGEAYLFRDLDKDSVFTDQADDIVNNHDNKSDSTPGMTLYELPDNVRFYDNNSDGEYNAGDELIISDNMTYNESENDIVVNFGDDDYLDVTNDSKLVNITGIYYFTDIDESGNLSAGDEIVQNIGGSGTYSDQADAVDSFYMPNQANPLDLQKGSVYPTNDDFEIQSMERIRITIDDVEDTIFLPSNQEMISIGNPIDFSIQTTLTNTFDRIFLPPTANIDVREESESFVLDGTDSFSQNDSSIVEWEWNLTNMNTNPPNSLPLKYGKRVNANRVLVDHDGVYNETYTTVEWNISLTVTNNHGMIGKTNFTHFQDFKSLMTQKEDLEIIDFRVDYNNSNEKIKWINFSIKNNFEFGSNITKLMINDMDCSDNIPSSWNPIESFDTSSLVTVSLDESEQVDMEQPLTIKFKTALGNTFEKTFYPPNPIATLSMQPSYNGQSYEDSIKLDATDSQAITENSYLVNYSWNVNYTFYYININDDDDDSYDISDDYRIQSISELNWKRSWDENHSGSGKNVSFLWDDLNVNGSCDSNEVKKVINGTFKDMSNINISGNYTLKSGFDNDNFKGSLTVLSPIISYNVNKIILNIKDNHGMKSSKQVYP